jgi:hypothetical protein
MAAALKTEEMSLICYLVVNGGCFGGGSVHPTAVYSPTGVHLTVFPPGVVPHARTSREEEEHIDGPGAKHQDDLEQLRTFSFCFL